MAINSDKKTEAGKKTASSEGSNKGGAKFFAAYMRRDGPKAPGSKPIPIGKANCFAGLKFLCTGVLESTERPEFERLVKQYGGSIISGVTKKLDYLVVGNDPGHAKLKTADELKIKQLTEDQFLQLIVTKSGITGTPRYEGMEELDAEMAAAMMDSENDENEPKDANKKSKLKKLLVESDDETPVRSESPKKEAAKTPEKKHNVI
jgi:replication factor C subunit 1